MTHEMRNIQKAIIILTERLDCHDKDARQILQNAIYHLMQRYRVLLREPITGKLA